MKRTGSNWYVVRCYIRCTKRHLHRLDEEGFNSSSHSITNSDALGSLLANSHPVFLWNTLTLWVSRRRQFSPKLTRMRTFPVWEANVLHSWPLTLSNTSGGVALTSTGISTASLLAFMRFLSGQRKPGRIPCALHELLGGPGCHSASSGLPWLLFGSSAGLRCVWGQTPLSMAAETAVGVSLNPRFLC